ncbi:MAG: hypothetical protein AMS22_11640 [Thiotrichales bacterium SG8_50]|nr:MAG: hypothetical protein AMS22_11640 [Thiotrichales bacterium SG8_50]
MTEAARLGPRRLVDSFSWYHLLLFSGLTVLYGVWCWSTELGDFGGDNAYYLLTARHFSPWLGPSDVASHFAVHSPYPPLFPLVLALTGGGASVLAAHLVVAAGWVVAIVVFYLWLDALEFTRVPATVAAVLFGLLPAVLLEALSVHSEALYLPLTLVALWSIARYEHDGAPSRLYVAVVAIGLASITRSAGVSLAVAFGAYLLVHRPIRFGWLLGAAAAPMVVWSLISPNRGHGYVAQLMDRYGSDPLGSLVSQVSVGLRALWRGWILAFGTGYTAMVVLSLVGLICIVGMLYRVWRWKFDGLYAGAYLLLIVLWPFPAEAQRLVLVIVPVLVAQALLLLGALPGLKSGRWVLRHLQVLALAPLVIVVAPELALGMQRFVRPLPDDLMPYRQASSWYGAPPREAIDDLVSRAAVAQHLRTLDNWVGPDECVYGMKPSIIGFYGARISYPPPGARLSDEEFLTAVRTGPCSYFYVMGYISPSFPTPYYPVMRLGESLRTLTVSTSRHDEGRRPIARLEVLVDRHPGAVPDRKAGRGK